MLKQTTATDTGAHDSEKCRTQYLTEDFSDCLTDEKKYRCNHAFPFVDGYLCTHPNHRDFK